MARKLTFSQNRFDGGMTHKLRDTSNPSKCAFASHLDIFNNPYEMEVMPGLVSDQDYNSTTDGLKTYKVRAFWYDGKVYGIGNKSDGTGSKLFYKASPTDAEWDDGRSGTSQEGTDDLWPAPYAKIGTSDGQEIYVTTTNGTDAYFTEYFSTVTDKFATIDTVSTGDSNPMQLVRGAGGNSDKLYFNCVYGDLGSLNEGSVTVNRFDTTPGTGSNLYITSMAESSRGLWMTGFTFHPYSTEAFLWDRASSSSDVTVYIPSSRGGAIGVVNDIPVLVTDDLIDSLKGTSSLTEQVNGRSGFSVYVINGTTPQVQYRMRTDDSTTSVLLPLSGYTYSGAMLFYAKFTNPNGEGGTRQGIFAVGQATDDQLPGMVMLVDTSSFSQLDGFGSFANHMYFAHDDDGSVSRLDLFDTGTYDIAASYETLMLFAGTPNDKQFEGVSVVTNELPSGGSVTAYYRTSTDDSWTSLGSSSTTGETEHNFTRASAAPIGNFQEIQFKFTFSGKLKIKNITASVTELDNLPYSV